MSEIWKPVPEYDNYMVSTNGVKSLNYRNTGKEKILTPGISQGHFVYTLSQNNKHKTFGLQVLIWLAFVGPIQKGYIVHHINECPEDNRLENLELVTKQKHMFTHHAIKVNQFDMQGNFIQEWNSISEINKVLGYSQGLISQCCNNKREKAYNFIWSRAY